jgi:hypothetical protein
MSNRIFFAVCALAAVLFVALAAVMPQGLGARSPGPFGHPLAQAPDTVAEISARTATRIGANPRAAAALAGLRKTR